MVSTQQHDLALAADQPCLEPGRLWWAPDQTEVDRAVSHPGDDLAYRLDGCCDGDPGWRSAIACSSRGPVS